MSSINASLIKKLRDETGAGVIDCKKSLVEADGDYDKALKIVSEKGLKKALKKQDRETKIGGIGYYVHNNGMIGSLVELLCETDFVANNEEFKSLANEIAMQVSAMNPENKEELLEQECIKTLDLTIEKKIQLLSGKIGEKIELGRFVRMQVGA